MTKESLFLPDKSILNIFHNQTQPSRFENRTAFSNSCQHPLWFKYVFVSCLCISACLGMGLGGLRIAYQMQSLRPNGDRLGRIWNSVLSCFRRQRCEMASVFVLHVTERDHRFRVRERETAWIELRGVPFRSRLPSWSDMAKHIFFPSSSPTWALYLQYLQPPI